MRRAKDDTKGCKTWALASKGSKTSGEKELLAVQPRQHVLIPVSSTDHSSVEEADTEAGDWKDFLEENGASLYLPLEGSPHRPLGGSGI